MDKNYTKKELESLVVAKMAEIAELRKKHGDEVKSLQQNKEYYEAEMGKAKAELEQIHLVLDTVPNSIPRQFTHGIESWEVTKLSALARLAAWFASF